MDEQKLVKLLKEHFPSKNDFETFKSEFVGLKSDVSDWGRKMAEGFEEIKESIEDLKASSLVLDKILEQEPIPRIERLEKHAGFSPYVSASVEE